MRFNVVGIGEVLWDLLPAGPQLGGAPANFVYHAQALGAHAALISRIGRDALGREVLNRFQAMGLSASGIQEDTTAATGTVEVTLAPGGIPNYVIHAPVAWDHIAASPAAVDLVRAAQVICFGSLAQRHAGSRNAIQELLAGAAPDAWRILDVNLRQDFFNRGVIESSLKLANVLKLNDQELPVIAGMFAVAGDPRQQIQALASRFGLQVVALTRGAAGSLLYRDGQWARGTAPAVEVRDTVGAGDAFTAALTMGLLHGLDLAAISGAANRIAAFVCGCSGAMPELPTELRRLLNPDSPPSIGV